GPKGCRVDQSRQHAAVDNAIGLQMTMGEIQLHPGKILLDIDEAETDVAGKGTLVGLGDDLLNVGWIDLGHAGLQAMVRKTGPGQSLSRNALSDNRTAKTLRACRESGAWLRYHRCGARPGCHSAPDAASNLFWTLCLCFEKSPFY